MNESNKEIVAEDNSIERKRFREEIRTFMNKLTHGPSGRSHITAGNILTLLAMAGALFGFWLNVSMEAGAQKQRVDTVEKRQVEDRAENKEKLNEIRSDVKQISADLQRVLRVLERVEGREEGKKK